MVSAIYVFPLENKLIKCQDNNEIYKWTFLRTWKCPWRSTIFSKVSSFYIITWTHFFPGFPLYTPWKHKISENLVFSRGMRLSDVIRGYKRETLGRNGLTKTTLHRGHYWPFLKVSFYLFIYNVFLFKCVQLKYTQPEITDKPVSWTD